MAERASITSGNFTFSETSIPGVIIVDVERYGDERGFFMETYKESDFKVIIRFPIAEEEVNEQPVV